MCAWSYDELNACGRILNQNRYGPMPFFSRLSQNSKNDGERRIIITGFAANSRVYDKISPCVPLFPLMKQHDPVNPILTGSTNKK